MSLSLSLYVSLSLSLFSFLSLLNEERQEGRSRSRLLADHFPYCRILSTHYVAADIFRGRFSESNCEELTWHKVV